MGWWLVAVRYFDEARTNAHGATKPLLGVTMGVNLAIYRTKHERDYTVLPNALINNSALDWRDLGLLVYLLSKPEDWNVSVSHLIRKRKAGRDQIYKILQALTDAGYCEPRKQASGKMDYFIYDKPHTDFQEQGIKPPLPEKPDPENPHPENRTLQSTDTTQSTEKEESTESATIPAVVQLYHETLPDLPKTRKLTKAREGYIRQRIREDLPTLESWVDFFRTVSLSGFLMGRAHPTNGRPPFKADLEWLTKPGNYAKIIEGKYDNESNQRTDQRINPASRQQGFFDSLSRDLRAPD